MLGIILTVLKIVGWVLLGIIALILLIGAIVLFVPVRYKIYARKYEEDNRFEVIGRITWLLHLLNVRIGYPGEDIMRVRVFLFKIYPKKKKEKHLTEKRTKKNKKDKTDAQTAKSEELDDFDENFEDGITFEKVTEAVEESSNIIVEEVFDDDPTLKKFIKKIFDTIRNVKESILKIINKVKKIYHDIKYYIDILKSDTFKRAYEETKTQLGKLFRIIRPRKIKGYANIGFEDPSVTGMVYGLYSVIYPFIGNSFAVLPYFEVENTVLNGEILLKGRITIFSLIRVGAKLYFNKDIKKLLKLLKKES